MPRCLFVSDLHGRSGRYARLFETIRAERPEAVFLGGDLLPNALGDAPHAGDFLGGYLLPELGGLRDALGAAYPDVFAILGNDDPRSEEPALLDGEARGLCRYVHARRVAWRGFEVYGYAFTPPSPFPLKDWERYDVSRYVDPGSVSPEEGRRSVPVEPREVRYATIRQDLERLAGEASLERALFLFHAPPWRSRLDRAALDGRRVDHVPLDVHVGSIAIRRFIEARQPLVTLHGHVHESARLTGDWRQRFGRTLALSAAHDGPELALVRFDPDAPGEATRDLLPV